MHSQAALAGGVAMPAALPLPCRLLPQLPCLCTPRLNLPPSIASTQVWVAPGMGLGEDFVASLTSLSDDSSVVMLAILLVFAIAHSGLAFLRPYGAHHAAHHVCCVGGWCRPRWCCTPAHLMLLAFHLPATSTHPPTHHTTQLYQART